jgi:1-acyl-sn-glycerol-3-phosphate acyltransferase
LPAGTLFIQRGAGDSSTVGAQIAVHLQAGQALLLFPEGTTSDGQSLRTFHGPLLSVVIEQPIALQPVAIRYWRDGQLDTTAAFIGDDDLLSHLRRLLAAPTAQVSIDLLPPLLAQAGENRNQLAPARNSLSPNAWRLRQHQHRRLTQSHSCSTSRLSRKPLLLLAHSNRRLNSPSMLRGTQSP